jgi:molybdopterin-guanine dinucleotide biosynthesis protein A
MGRVMLEFEAGILIGGQSKRFGQDKASLRFGDTTLLERIYHVLHKVIDNIWIIGHNQGYFELPADIFFEDIIPDAGPMGGLLTALKKTKKPTLIVSCDTPFIELEHVEYLIKQYDSTRVATIARSSKGIEPLFGIYKPELCTLLEKLIHLKRLALYRIFDYEKVKFVNFLNIGNISDIFFNINTLSDYKKALYLWEETEIKNSTNSVGGKNG